MKIVKRKILGFIITAVMLAACSLTAFADGTVTYDGTARDFIFSPGSEYSPTDLFTDFKNVMPGDSITQKVTVNNRIDKKVKIKVYMRSLGADESSEEFLSKLNLTVKQDGKSKLFDAPADETAQLTDWVYLGTVYSGGKIDLDVTLNVPIELENRFQDAIGYLDWEFKVEELPVEKNDPKPLGDAPQYLLYGLLIGAAVLAVIILIALRRRRRDD